jgi:hypothetical protein
VNALLREIRALPLTDGILSVRVLADEVADGFCLVRTDTSPGVDVAVVYDGTDRSRGEAEGYARVLSVAPAMLGLLTGVLAKWGEAVEEDTPIEGADAVQWLAKFTVEVRETLLAITASVQSAEPEIHVAEIPERPDLIASAPELLSLLQQARAALPDTWTETRCDRPRELIEAIDAAIGVAIVPTAVA